MKRAEATFFATADAFRAWLEKNHDREQALWVGLVKAGSGLSGINYREALDEALAFGWIDGVRFSIDDKTWAIRFSRRKRGSIWSHVNIRRVGELREAGRMHPAGEAVFAARREERSGLYSFEQATPPALTADQEAAFRAAAAAWAWFAAQPKSYRVPAIWWVVSAKKEETRAKRLKTLIADSAAGRRIKPLARPRPTG